MTERSAPQQIQTLGTMPARVCGLATLASAAERVYRDAYGCSRAASVRSRCQRVSLQRISSSHVPECGCRGLGGRRCRRRRNEICQAFSVGRRSLTTRPRRRKWLLGQDSNLQHPD